MREGRAHDAFLSLFRPLSLFGPLSCPSFRTFLSAPRSQRQLNAVSLFQSCNALEISSLGQSDGPFTGGKNRASCPFSVLYPLHRERVFARSCCADMNFCRKRRSAVSCRGPHVA